MLIVLLFVSIKFQNTSKANIYALGDVCGKALLTPGMKKRSVDEDHCTGADQEF